MNLKHLKILKEEFDTNQEEISRAEKIWGTKFPKDYVEFLLQNNGAIVYPNFPVLGPENKTELWGVERFFSVGDVIIQKLYPMTYTLHDIYEEDFEEHNLKPEHLLVFAQGDRGIYFFNLAEEEHGHIYIANYSGGDGISRTSASSFTEFIMSLGLPDWYEQEFDPNFEFTDAYHSEMKVLALHLYYTPENPELGFQRFKEVFEYIGEVMPQEDGYPAIAQKYVDDRLKLDYLLEKGCSTEGLLTRANKAETIRYLIEELNLDINKKYKKRYPLQNYLGSGSEAFAKHRYELINDLLEMGIEMDWSIQAKNVDGKDDLPMIEKLRILHNIYKKLELKEQEFRIKYRRPSGISAFIKSPLIEEKLGIIEQVKEEEVKEGDSWADKLLNRIIGGSKQ